jgi:thiamine-phosphate diphosphorylase
MSFVAAQIASLVEDIRLLEAFVTGPLGLHSDIRMLRQSMPLPEAADLPRDEARKRRLAYGNLSGDPAQLAIRTVEHIASSVAVLEEVSDASRSPISPEWLARARRVLARAEHKVASDLRSGTVSRLRGLYVIVDPEATGGRAPSQVAEAALRGGAAVIQLRDKRGDGGRVLESAREIRSMCDGRDALFVMNGDSSIALRSEAHGLHLGKHDLPVLEARRVLSAAQIVGRSNNSLGEVAGSQAEGVDYLAVGVEMVAKVKQTASQPVVATGCIGPDDVADVVRAGADCVCVASAVTQAADPEAAAATLTEAIAKARA